MCVSVSVCVGRRSSRFVQQSSGDDMGEGSERMLDRDGRGGDLNSSAVRDRQRIPVSVCAWYCHVCVCVCTRYHTWICIYLYRLNLVANPSLNRGAPRAWRHPGASEVRWVHKATILCSPRCARALATAIKVTHATPSTETPNHKPKTLMHS